MIYFYFYCSGYLVFYQAYVYVYYSIAPRKGQFIVFGKTASNLIKSSIIPIPGKTSKGIITFKTGNSSIILLPKQIILSQNNKMEDKKY